MAADGEVGVCASTAGIEVLATELYGAPRLPRDEVLARLTESLGGGLTDTWVEQNNLPENARAGADDFQEAGCMSCHSYLSAGAGGPGPELSEIGAQSGKNVDYFVRYISNPREFGNNVMPVYASFGEKTLNDLAVFLAASKGPGGG